MPIYQVEIDGKINEVDSGDQELSDSDLAQLAAPSAAAPASSPTRKVGRSEKLSYGESMKGAKTEVYDKFYEPGSFTKGVKMIAKGVIGALEQPISMASGAFNSAAGGLSGGARAAYGMATGEDFDTAMNKGADVVRKAQSFTYEPKTDAGKGMQRMIAAPFEAISEAGGAVGETLGAIKSPGAGAAGRTLGEHALDIAGTVIPAVRAYKKGSKPVAMIPMSQEEKAIAKSQEKGFMVNPSQANPSILNKVLNSLGGKYIDEKIAEKNADVVNKKARSAMGLPETADLDEAAFQSYRSAQSAKYARLKDYKTPFELDDTFKGEIRDLDKAFRAIKENTPELYDNTALETLRASLSEPKNPAHPGKLTAEAVVDISRQLRAEATKTLKNPTSTPKDQFTALAKRDAANAMEDLLERHLEKSGQTQLLKDYKEGRKGLALSHDVEDATNLTTGNVDPQVLRRLMEKGRPLSGDLKDIAQAASISKKTMKNIDGVSPTAAVTASDVGTAGLLHAVSKGTLPAGIPLVRPVAASVASSKWYQKRMGSPKERKAPRFSMRDEAAVAGAAGQTSPQPPQEEEQ